VSFSYSPPPLTTTSHQSGDDVSALLRHPSYSLAFHMVIENLEGIAEKGWRENPFSLNSFMY
jgi:hypothetical protein